MYIFHATIICTHFACTHSQCMHTLFLHAHTLLSCRTHVFIRLASRHPHEGVSKSSGLQSPTLTCATLYACHTHTRFVRMHTYTHTLYACTHTLRMYAHSHTHIHLTPSREAMVPLMCASSLVTVCNCSFFCFDTPMTYTTTHRGMHAHT